MLVYPAGKADTAFQVPDTVTSFVECVFKYNPNLKDILIPASVTNLGKDLFYDNNSITVYAPDDSAAAAYAQLNGLALKSPTEFPPEHVHTLTAVAAKDSTCTVKGNIAYWYCAECLKYLSDANGTDEITKAETELPLAEHTEVTIPGKAATCTEAGLTNGTKCSVCGEILVAQKEIPAKGHYFENGVCSVCGAEDPNYVKPTEPVEPTTEPTTEPTAAPEATTAPQSTEAPDASQAPGTTAPSTDVPPTGDAASVLVWMSVLVLAGTGILALLAKRKSN